MHKVNPVLMALTKERLGAYVRAEAARQVVEKLKAYMTARHNRNLKRRAKQRAKKKLLTMAKTLPMLDVEGEPLYDLRGKPCSRVLV